jgi:tripartite-type tricarboxylate transporter receptor subunit TctC
MKSLSIVARTLAASMLIVIAGSGIAQQAYPNKPIRFIVPYAPGGGTTPLARIISQKLADNWGQQVIVDNRPGGNTLIGTETLLRSPPDGYTILLMGDTFVLLPALSQASYDPIRDFAPVATLSRSERLLVVHPSVPANTLQEFIALAKAKPGQLNFGSAASGGQQHLIGEMFNLMAGVKTQHIPYKGSGPALADLIGGQIQFSYNNPLSTIALVKSGKLRAIAISGDARLAALPDVPTFAEGGLRGFDVTTTYGVTAPAGTPKDIVNKLSGEIARILATPETSQVLVSQGMEPFINTPEQVAALLKAELAKYAELIKVTNIRYGN